MRARLEREEGPFPKNHVIWFGAAALIGSPPYTTEGLLAMDRWLAAVEADPRRLTLTEKVAADRPEDVHDKCSNVEVVEEASVPGVGPVCQLPLAETRFATPRVVAGVSLSPDTQDGQPKPLTQSAYYPTVFTAQQWAQLQQAFPAGVCDFSKS